MPKGNTKKDSDKEVTSESDPFLLFKHYCKQCEAVGIGTNDAIKKALCHNESPTYQSQLLLGPAGADSPTIGDGGCRALVSAILGECEHHGPHDTTNPSGNSEYKYTAFEDIRIWRSKIGDNGAAALSRLLRRCNGMDFKVWYLELSDNQIRQSGALSLGRSLCSGTYQHAQKMNKTLLTLKLDYNNTLGSDGIIALAKGLKLNSTLQVLSLKFCGIDEKGGNALSEIIAFPRTAMQTLNLEGNHLCGEGLKRMCPGLQSNSSLRKLSLTDIGLMPNDADALEEFGRAIGRHPSLNDIILLRNAIGDEGGLNLSKYVAENKIITSLKIDTALSPDIYDTLCRIPSNEKKSKKKGSGKKKK